ncbi:MAG: methylated-DNA--[protein]-cysteine S-methyltransferase [Chloroflexota bacterium]|nr:methylated-DNA--[protein]-cysteine S-methyltransferase [Chloroflexota bacterium]
MILRVDEIESPIGVLTLVATPAALCALDFHECRDRLLGPLLARYPGAALAEEADPNGYSSRVRAYLAGDLRAIDDIPVDPGGTPFQRVVWSALQDIRPGTTTTYGALAARLGRSGAARAVGAANARNPICLVIPCHRLVSAAGTLIGYSGGLHRKRWFLEHEGVRLPSPAIGTRLPT